MEKSVMGKLGILFFKLDVDISVLLIDFFFVVI